MSRPTEEAKSGRKRRQQIEDKSYSGREQQHLEGVKKLASKFNRATVLVLKHDQPRHAPLPEVRSDQAVITARPISTYIMTYMTLSSMSPTESTRAQGIVRWRIVTHPRKRGEAVKAAIPQLPQDSPDSSSSKSELSLSSRQH